MTKLLTTIEAAVDSSTDLTRKSVGGFMCEAELVFSRCGWEARCQLRGTRAKGRGAKQMITAKGEGVTPEEAVKQFIAGLDAWSHVLNKE